METRSLGNNDGVKKELGVNVKKKKMMISSETTGKGTEKSKSLCAVCWQGGESNSILCLFCRC